MKKQKQNRGITLISLIIAVIVILILVGVSINFIFGNEGIFSKAQIAVGKYQNVTEEEQAQIAKINNEINNYVSGDRDYEIEINNLKTRIAELENLNSDSKQDYEALLEEKKQLEEDLENARVQKIFLGSYNSQQSRTIDVSNYEGYENFTKDNFVFQNISLYNENNGSKKPSMDNHVSNIHGSYNPNTGKFTLNKSSDADSTSWFWFVTYDLYLLYGNLYTPET